MPVAKIVNERIPKGRYWADVLERNRSAFDGWSDATRKAKLARVDHVEEFGDRAFVIFTVTAETGAPWPEDSDLPVPNIASSSVNSSSDTADRPDPPKDIVDTIGDSADTLKTIALGIAAIIALVLANSALSRR